MIKRLVENPHVVYLNHREYWDFLLESYEGGIDYTRSSLSAKNYSDVNDAFKIQAGGKQLRTTTNSNLFAHPKERNEDYQDRVRMSYYYNFCAPIIDIYTNHLFKQPVNVDWGKLERSIEERKNDIDRQQSSIIEFRKEMTELAQMYGHIFVLCDAPQITMPIRSLAEQMQYKAFPYLTFYHPQNVINWALDAFGQPYWVLLRETYDVNVDPAKYDPSKKKQSYYRLWTTKEWILYDGDYKEIMRGSHNVGKVPITCVFDKKSKKVRNFLGISFIADIVFIAREIYNSCSELKQILRDQTFAFLAFEGDSSEYNAIEVGTCKGLLYPVGRKAPQYLSPPPSNAEVYFTHIDRQVSKVFQLAKLEGGSVKHEQSAVQQSGTSKKWDFNQTNSALSKKAGAFEDGETKVWDLFARWEGGEFDGVISYPKEFSIQSLNDDLDEAEKIMKISIGNEFNKEIKKAIIKKKFPRMQEKDIKKLTDDVDNNEGKTMGTRLAERLKKNTPNSGG